MLELQRLAGNEAVAGLVLDQAAQRQVADPWASSTAGPDTGTDVKLRVQQLRLAIRMETMPPKFQFDRGAVLEALDGLTPDEGRAVRDAYGEKDGWNLRWMISGEQEIGNGYKMPNNLNSADRKRLLLLLDGSVAPAPAAPAVESTGRALGTVVEMLGGLTGHGEEAAKVSEALGSTVGQQISGAVRRADEQAEDLAAKRRAAADAAAFKAALDRKEVDAALAFLRRDVPGREALTEAYRLHFGEPLILGLMRRLTGKDMMRAMALLAGDTVLADRIALEKDVAEAEQLNKDLAEAGDVAMLGDYVKARQKQAKGKIEARVEQIAGGGDRRSATGRELGRRHLEAVLGESDPGNLRQRIGVDSDAVLTAIVEGDPAAELGARLARQDAEQPLKPAVVEKALRDLDTLAPAGERHQAVVDGYFQRFLTSFDANNRRRTLAQVLAGHLGRTASLDDMLATVGVDPVDLERNKALFVEGGNLPEWQEMFYALTRDPRDMPRVREILGSKTKEGVAALATLYHDKTPGHRSMETDLLGEHAAVIEGSPLMGGDAREAISERRELLQGGEFSTEATDEAIRLAEEGAWLFDRIAGLEHRVMENRGAFAEVRDWIGNLEHELVQEARTDATAARKALDLALGGKVKQVSAAAIQVRELRRVHARLVQAVDAYKESTKAAFDEFVDLAVMVVGTAATLGQGGLLIMALRGTAARIGTKLALKQEDYSADEFIGDLRGGLADLAGGAVVNKLYKPLAASWAASAAKAGLSPSLVKRVATRLGPMANWEAEQQIQSIVGGIVQGRGPELMGLEGHYSAAQQAALAAVMGPKSPVKGDGGTQDGGSPKAGPAGAAAGEPGPGASAVGEPIRPTGGSEVRAPAADVAPGGTATAVPQTPDGGSPRLGTPEERHQAHAAYARARAQVERAKRLGDPPDSPIRRAAQDELTRAYDDFVKAHGRRPDQPPPTPDKWDTEMVIQDANPTSHAEAKKIFDNLFEADPWREVGVYRNDLTGEYIVIQGRRSNVSVETDPLTGQSKRPLGAGEAQRWKEVLDQRSDVGRWQLVAHTHPGQRGTRNADPLNHFPSSATGDFGVMVIESQERGWQPRQSEIVYNTPDGRRSTVFGFDPTNPQPYWIVPADGQTYRFDSLEAYQTFIRATFPYVKLDPVPSNMPTGSGLGRYARPGGG